MVILQCRNEPLELIHRLIQLTLRATGSEQPAAYHAMPRRSVWTKIASIVPLLCLKIAAQAQPVAGPAKGQSSQQEQKERWACVSRGKSKTGVDPATAAVALGLCGRRR